MQRAEPGHTPGPHGGVLLAVRTWTRSAAPAACLAPDFSVGAMRQKPDPSGDVEMRTEVTTAAPAPTGPKT